MGLRLLLAGSALLAAILVAHADTIQTFRPLGSTDTTPHVRVSGAIHTTTDLVQNNHLSVLESGSTETLIDDASTAEFGMNFGDSISSPSPTPHSPPPPHSNAEPDRLALLGTGLIGLGGILRKRFA
jgi:hypothetical protein